MKRASSYVSLNLIFRDAVSGIAGGKMSMISQPAGPAPVPEGSRLLAALACLCLAAAKSPTTS